MALDFTTMDQGDAEELGVLAEWHDAHRDHGAIARKQARWARSAEARQRTDGRRGGAFVSILDAETLLSAARAQYAAEHPDTDAAALVDHGPLPQMTFRAENNRAAVVNSEGMGTLSEGGTIEVFFTIGGALEPLPLPLSTIAQATGTEVADLAEGIRGPGLRLDASHKEWRASYTA